MANYSSLLAAVTSASTVEQIVAACKDTDLETFVSRSTSLPLDKLKERIKERYDHPVFHLPYSQSLENQYKVRSLMVSVQNMALSMGSYLKRLEALEKAHRPVKPPKETKAQEE